MLSDRERRHRSAKVRAELLRWGTVPARQVERLYHSENLEELEELLRKSSRHLMTLRPSYR